ncbi:MAG: ROK family protein [Elusimicrobiota bacterium]
MIAAEPRIRPPLDHEFQPVRSQRKELREVLDCASYEERRAEGTLITMAVLRGGAKVHWREFRILPHAGEAKAHNEWAVERWAKLLQWKVGGDVVTLSGCRELADFLDALYAPGGKRAFDREFFRRIYKGTAAAGAAPLGGHWKGCRVGFDLGATDRKCAAVKDGEVVHTEEVAWNPGSFTDPRRHIEEIQDSIRRAARKLPRVDAIGGCAAGIIVGGEIRRSSLFRGIPEDGYEALVRPVLREVRRPWKDAPFAVLNDGAVTALAGARALGRDCVLGLAMGSSLAAGYVHKGGCLPDTIDELAFVPIDDSADAPRDPWSGERGCAAQYLSQQGVVRLARAAGFGDQANNAPAEVLRFVQQRMGAGDSAAFSIYESIGVYLGYALLQYLFFYAFTDVLLLGRVMSGPGGAVIISAAREVLDIELPGLGEKIALGTLDERDKRHGQAVAAASLPPGGGNGG